MTPSDLPPDTLRPCEACGGERLSSPCRWCDDGFQTPAQYLRWAHFRERMRLISTTYEFLPGVVADVVERLELRGTADALDLAREGRRLLQEWERAPATGGRREVATRLLSDLITRALDYLTTA